MKWYLLRPSVLTLPTAPLPIVADVIDLNGRAVENDESPVGQHEVRKGVSVESLGTVYMKINKRVELTDCLLKRFQTKLIISEPALEHFMSAGCRLHPDIFLLPTIILDPVTKCSRAKYKTLWPRKIPVVLDRSRSEIDVMVGGRAIRSVKKWVLQESLLSGIDLFQSESLDWISSQRLFDVVQNSSFTGFGFLPLET